MLEKLLSIILSPRCFYIFAINRESFSSALNLLGYKLQLIINKNLMDLLLNYFSDTTSRSVRFINFVAMNCFLGFKQFLA